MSFAIYLVGFLILIGGLIYGATIMHMATHWIVVGAVILVGLAMVKGVQATRGKDSSELTRAPPGRNAAMRTGTAYRFTPTITSSRKIRGEGAAVLLIGTIAALYFTREILIPFAFALTLAFLLSPAVAVLERLRAGRVSRVPFY